MDGRGSIRKVATPCTSPNALQLLPIAHVDDATLDREAIAIAHASEAISTHGAHYVALAARYGTHFYTSLERL